MNFKHRLRKLEKSLVSTEPDATDDNGVKYCTLDEAALWVRVTMSLEHEKFVIEENDSYKEWWELDPLLRRGPVPSRCHLTIIFNQFVKEAASKNMRPIHLPPHVAEVYLNDTSAQPDHECEKCGYRVPVTELKETGEIKVYFPQCPLCGGNTGKHVWASRRFDSSDRLKWNNQTYKNRKREYFERLIKYILDNREEGSTRTREQIIDTLSENYPDIRKYLINPYSMDLRRLREISLSSLISK
jgi:hypothetical protein